MKETEVHVTYVGRMTTIVRILNVQPWVGNVHKKYHFAKVCKTNRVNCVDLGDLNLGHQDGASGRRSDRYAHEYMFRIDVNILNTDYLLEVETGGVRLHVLADSGAYSNLIDERKWGKL